MSLKKPVNINNIHPCLDANYNKGQSAQRAMLLIPSGQGGRSLDKKHNWDTYMIKGKIRRLTPKECERLMSWPDDWTRSGIDDKGNKVEISDSQRYKMAGNGVCSCVVKEIIKNIIPKSKINEEGV